MAPEFAADQDPNMTGDQPNAARSVAENTEAGSTVGDPVTADPKDGDVLTYTLEDEDGGIDGDSTNFDIDRATGQILTKVKSALNAEGGGTTTDDEGNAYVEYTVEVRATDPAEVPGTAATADASAAVTVVIRVTDVNDAPKVAANTTTLPTFEETAGSIATVLQSYTATDDDQDTTTLSLEAQTGASSRLI